MVWVELSNEQTNGVLHYSRRQDLLRGARRLGIGRFQANLLIAAVQHHYEGAGGQAEVRSSQSSFLSERVVQQPRKGHLSATSLVAALLLIAVIEAAAVAVAWSASPF